MNLKERVLFAAPTAIYRVVRLACIAALLGLGTFAFGIVYPRPLAVVLSMSIGHAFGVLAFLLFLLAVIADASMRGRGGYSLPPGSRPSGPSGEAPTKALVEPPAKSAEKSPPAPAEKSDS